MPVFTCKVTENPSSLTHSWETVVGSGHAPLALRADWQRQIKRCHEELGFQYVRFHGLLSDDLGTLVRQEQDLIYSFFNADQIFDYLLSIGMRPFVEFSFMPTALASGTKTVFSYNANVTPPIDYGQWSDLIKRLVRHWIDRYGLNEVQQWFLEVWNEPNIKQFWTGTQDDYFELYKHTFKAIKDINPSLRVGGPATAKNAWIEAFLDYCEKHQLDVDFVSTHHYPTDAFGNSDDDIEAQLAQSQRSILREQTQDAKRQTRGKPLYYTEWNTSSGPRDLLHDQPYAAAFITKTVMEAQSLVEGYGFWTFSDIFEENYFPSVPFHGGFGLLNLHGIPKPSYRAFEILHRLGNELLHVDGAHPTVDVWVTRENQKITILLSNTALPGYPLTTEQLIVRLEDVAQPQDAYIERIDENHANAYKYWVEIGKPEYLSTEQVAELEEASKLNRETCAWRYDNRTLEIDVSIPSHAVAAITLELD